MPLWIAGAVLGSAVLGGISANKAAGQQADATKKGIDESTRLAEQSRMDAINLFNQGRQARLLGQRGAFDFYKQNAQNVTRPLIQGNMLAQQAVGQGGIQANNAILGLPVDMSFANRQQQVTPDYSAVNTAQLPILGNQYNVDSGQDQKQQSLQEAQNTARAAINKFRGVA